MKTVMILIFFLISFSIILLHLPSSFKGTLQGCLWLSFSTPASLHQVVPWSQLSSGVFLSWGRDFWQVMEICFHQRWSQVVGPSLEGTINRQGQFFHVEDLTPVAAASQWAPKKTKTPCKNPAFTLLNQIFELYSTCPRSFTFPSPSPFPDKIVCLVVIQDAVTCTIIYFELLKTNCISYMIWSYLLQKKTS